MLPPLPDEGNRRAITVSVAVYTGSVLSSKVEIDHLSTDLSRSYLSKLNRIYPATKKRRTAWFDAGMHLTKCLRIHVALPFGQAAVTRKPKIKTLDGSLTEESMADEMTDDDVVVNLDRSNLHLLIGGPSVSQAHQKLYALLKDVTMVSGGWGGEA